MRKTRLEQALIRRIEEERLFNMRDRLSQLESYVRCLEIQQGLFFKAHSAMQDEVARLSRKVKS